ncbi:hypothetical protein CAPTEDRAFT_207913 [Capitella teleta]|uniref:Uncharacterized protein n=1 Tax=Capitella teleta TaxID=283909 RepID=R7VKR4_CAPTE|nr:hypothetical protein CAPTEDRAFT_207913 [Capitella teleta]|eukprot:ELU17601.1 hypothetical protein CAPTEDRAFT_207913 [Capitella teleta]
MKTFIPFCLLIGVAFAVPLDTKSLNDAVKEDAKVDNISELREKLRNLNNMLGKLDGNLQQPAKAEALNKLASKEPVDEDEAEVLPAIIPELSKETQNLLEVISREIEKAPISNPQEEEASKDDDVNELELAANQVAKEQQRKELIAEMKPLKPFTLNGHFEPFEDQETQHQHDTWFNAPLPDPLLGGSNDLEVEKFSSRLLKDLAVAKKGGITLQDLLRAIHERGEINCGFS